MRPFVSVAVVSALLCAPVFAEPSKTIAVSIREEEVSTSGKGSAPSSSFQDSFRAALTREGFKVVDAKSGPQHVVTGTVTGVTKGAPGSANADLQCTLQIVSGGSTREIVGGVSKHVTAKENYAVGASALGSEVAAEVIEQLRALTSKTAESGQLIQLTVHGLKDFKSMQSFKQSVTTVDGVTDASGGSVHDGKATYDVTYRGSADAFAKALSQTRWKQGKATAKALNATGVELKFK
jgi:hypothetical protein